MNPTGWLVTVSTPSIIDNPRSLIYANRWMLPRAAYGYTREGHNYGWWVTPNIQSSKIFPTEKGAKKQADYAVSLGFVLISIVPLYAIMPIIEAPDSPEAPIWHSADQANGWCSGWTAGVVGLCGRYSWIIWDDMRPVLVGHLDTIIPETRGSWQLIVIPSE